LKQVDDIKTLQQYYNVDPRLLVHIYDQFSVFKGKIIGKGTNKKFSSLVHDIWEWNKDKPGIYVITGPTGTGKSWFTYRLISKIFERNQRSKSQDQKEFSFYQIDNPSRFRYPVINEGNEKCIMFIDDSRIPLDSINKIENIIDEFRINDNPNGPIIITIEYNKWEKIFKKKTKLLEFSGPTLNDKLNKLNKKILQVFIERATDSEISKVLESFLNLEEYSRISIPESLKMKIVKKAAGFPIIIKILFESIKNKKINRIREIDIDDIDKDPEKYMMVKLQNSYIKEEWFENIYDYQEKISEVLSLLNAILKFNKDIPLPFLDYNFLKDISQSDNRTELMLYKILANTVTEAHLINIYIEDDELKLRMPFFELKYDLFIVPFHDIVKGGIDRLISSEMFRDYYIDYTQQLIGELNFLYQRINDIFLSNDIQLSYSIKNAYYLLLLSENSFNRDYEIKALEFASKIPGNIDPLIFRILFLIEHISYDKSKLSKLLQNNYIIKNDLLGRLFTTDDHDKRDIVWYKLITATWLGVSLKHVAKKYKFAFFELLNSNDLIAWYMVPDLINIGIINTNDGEYLIDIISNINKKIRAKISSIILKLIISGIIDKKYAIYSLKVLSSEDEKLRVYGWYVVPNLVRSALVDLEFVKINKRYFIKLLNSEDLRVRVEAWFLLPKLLETRVISEEEIIEYKPFFIDMLGSHDAIIRNNAWSLVPELIDCGIIDKSDKEYFIYSLYPYAPYPYVDFGVKLLNIWNAWSLVPKLIDSGIIDKDDREYFSYLLSPENDHPSVYAWSAVPKLLEAGIISKEEVIENKSVFIDMLGSEREPDIVYAWSVLPKLIEIGIISKEEVIENKSYFFDLLKFELLNSSEDLIAKLNEWSLVPKLIDSGIIDKDDREYFSYLLSPENDHPSVYAWSAVPKLLEAGIISKEEVIEKKGFFIYLLVYGFFSLDLSDSESDESLYLKDQLFKLSAWNIVPKLIEIGIISKKEIIENKFFFIDMLSSLDHNIRLKAWSLVAELIDCGIIDKKDAKDYKNYFIELLTSEYFTMRINAQALLPNLVELRIIEKNFEVS
jgi:GTPase SAR1 family protein